ncbi:unnamed protein product [Prunus armeniaca]|uniref:Uncharacterized protein n=1 Tax=Prunus armeniaca TaxID=36596 RepID=A0A6J5TIQ4_PRUAR|nr:unnamed protein product [Prunus armeniaca]
MPSEITTPRDAVHIQVDNQWEAFFVIKVGFVGFQLILIQKLGSNWVFGFILMADHHMLSAYLLEMPHSCWGCNDGNVILDFDLGSHMGIQDKCGGAFLKSYFIGVLMMEFH